jgi:hypothetical protein
MIEKALMDARVAEIRALAARPTAGHTGAIATHRRPTLRRRSR